MSGSYQQRPDFRGLDYRSIRRIIGFGLPRRHQVMIEGMGLSLYVGIEGPIINTHFSINNDQLMFSGMQIRDRGQGLARQVLANRLVFSDIVGLQHWTSGFRGIGSYAFARFGFEPFDFSWQQVRVRALDRVAPLAESWLLSGHGIPSIAAVVQILADNNPRRIWDLADLRDPRGGQSIGQSLLLNNHWIGSFDTIDPAQRERLTRMLSEMRLRLTRQYALSLLARGQGK